MEDSQGTRGAFAQDRREISRRPGETFAEYILRRLEWEDRREPEIERDRR